MKDLLLRSVTGLIYVAIIAGCIWGGIYSYAILFALITFLCLWEVYGLINSKKLAEVNQLLNSLGGIYLFFASFLFSAGYTPIWIFIPYFVYVLSVLIIELYRKKENPIANWAYSFFGQFYIALPVSLLNRAVILPSETGTTYAPFILLSLFIFIWINDTGAYLVGCSIGKKRLFERISPKKSWEGFFGGLVFTLLSSLLLAHFSPFQIHILYWMGLAFSIVMLGTMGDLMESLLKRTIDVKDSGNVLPGHGGFLDRFDSMLFAIYALLIFSEMVLR